ncbi:MAG: hypothetical protein ACLTSX_00840 [Collinsella sp.]
MKIDPSGKKMGKQLGDGLTEGAKSGGGGIMSAIGGIAKDRCPRSPPSGSHCGSLARPPQRPTRRRSSRARSTSLVSERPRSRR